MGLGKKPTFNVEIVGIDNFIRANKVSRAVAKGAFAESDIRVAKMAVVRTKPLMPGKTKTAVRSKGPVYEIGRRPAYAVASVLGADNRYGWYAGEEYAGHQSRQYKPFIGLNYVPGKNMPKKPYYIGEELEKVVSDVNDGAPHLYFRAFDRVVGRAYFYTNKNVSFSSK